MGPSPILGEGVEQVLVKWITDWNPKRISSEETLCPVVCLRIPTVNQRKTF
jgi:hypothetical protein